MGKIVLASSSPRRSDIMKSLELDFEKIPSDYVEEHNQTAFSYEYVENLAYQKALDVAKKVKDKIVIGADTIVVIENKILGKPTDEKEAFKMLSLLSNKKHFVVTAISIIDSNTYEHCTKSTTTYVTFYDLTEEQILSYIKNYKPFDKAGSYGIQELPDGFVKSIEGDLDNVIGLPTTTLTELLKNYNL